MENVSSGLWLNKMNEFKKISANQSPEILDHADDMYVWSKNQNM